MAARRNSDMPEETQKQQPVGARLKQLITGKNLGNLTCREWRQRLQKFGKAPSQATISRDLQWDNEEIPVHRAAMWAKAIGVPLNRLVDKKELNSQMHQPTPPDEKVVQSVKYWAFCPYKHCSTASWAIWKKTGELAKFRDYGWFNADEEGHYCRRCGTELVKECRTPSCEKRRIENRGDLYCGKCGKRFAETAVIAPQELYLRAMCDDWTHYKREEHVALLKQTLWRLQHKDFADPPLDLTADLAECLEHAVHMADKKIRADGSAPKMLDEELNTFVKLERVSQKLQNIVPPLVVAVKTSNQEFFEEREKWRRESGPDLEDRKRWQEIEEAKIAQGLIEPSEAENIAEAVQVPPPDEPEIPF
jgi:hypothetical protein